MAYDSTYAPEFSADNIGALIKGYSDTLQPQTEKDLRAVKASTFGQGLGYGSPYQAGVGEVIAGRNSDISKYGLALQQQGLAANAAGRESALGRQFTAGENALGRTFQTNERLGSQGFAAGESLLGRTFQNEQRLGNQAYGTSERQASQTFQQGENSLNRGLQEAGLTGMYNGQQTMEGKQAAAQQALTDEEKQIAGSLGFNNASQYKAYTAMLPQLEGLSSNSNVDQNAYFSKVAGATGKSVQDIVSGAQALYPAWSDASKIMAATKSYVQNILRGGK